VLSTVSAARDRAKSGVRAAPSSARRLLRRGDHRCGGDGEVTCGTSRGAAESYISIRCKGALEPVVTPGRKLALEHPRDAVREQRRGALQPLRARCGTKADKTRERLHCLCRDAEVVHASGQFRVRRLSFSVMFNNVSPARAGARGRMLDPKV